MPLGGCQIVNFEIHGAVCNSRVGSLGSARPNRPGGGTSRCRKLALLMTNGFSLDQAIHELVEVRNGLYAWLQPRPKITIQAPKNPRGRSGPYDKKGRPRASATAEPTKVTALLEQEIAQGFVEKVQGGHAELLERCSAEDLAIGKLGLQLAGSSFFCRKG